MTPHKQVSAITDSDDWKSRASYRTWRSVDMTTTAAITLAPSIPFAGICQRRYAKDSKKSRRHNQLFHLPSPVALLPDSG